MVILTQKPFLVLIYSINVILNIYVAQAADPLYTICDNDAGNYTIDSTYETNLQSALYNLPTTNSGYGFYNFSTGQEPDGANVIALCRGDVRPGPCQTCVIDFMMRLRQDCPNQKRAIIYNDDCLLKYSNETILRTIDMNMAVYMVNTQNVTDVRQFNEALRPLLTRLRGKAAAEGPLRKFDAENTTAPGFLTIYSLVQCTPDLSEQQCSSCLENAINQIPACCNGKRGGRILMPSCNIRNEIYPFNNGTTTIGPPPPPPLRPPVLGSPPPGKDTSAMQTKMIIIIPTFSFMAIVVASICIFRRKRKKRKSMEVFKNETMDISSVESLQFNFSNIKASTNDFNENNKLGQGGFGSVYKGMYNGEDIAVKRLSKDSGQGDLEFKNEVLLVARLQHRNLVRLLGFSLEGSERLLIYEFLPNASLDQFIFDTTKCLLLDWDRRYKIMVGIARGLLYLHEDSRLRIIHRDLKASNILLDTNMNPKIADFGMARLCNPEETQGSTNRIVGTYGYMAPEYALHGHFSVKSDVYSFGVLVLEIITGKKNQRFGSRESFEDLLSYVWKRWRDGTVSTIIDLTLTTSSSSLVEIIRCLHIGLLCVQEKVVDRPTMTSVLSMLNNLSLILPVPSEPAFFIHGSVDPEKTLQENSSFGNGCLRPSVNDASLSEIVPR